MIVKRRADWFVIWVFAIGSPMLATAQQVSAASQEAESAGGGLEEILVTAQKRAQLLQDVPISVSVLSAQAIELSNVKLASDLPQLAPALTFTAGAFPQFTSFNIRGQGSYVYRIGIQPAVSVVVDGVARARTAEAATELGEVERVEVLSGPQGTLFGRNSTGGAVNIVTKTPTDKLEGFVSGELLHGHLGDIEGQVRAAVNTPLTNGASNRVYVFDRENNDFVHNLYPGAPDVGRHRVYGVQDKLGIELGDVDILLSGDYLKDFLRNGTPTTSIPLQAYQQPNVPNIAAKQIAVWQGAVGQRFTVNDFEPVIANSEYYGGQGAITWHPSRVLTVTSLTAYRVSSVIGINALYTGPATPADTRGFDFMGLPSALATNAAYNPERSDNKVTRWHYFTQEVRAQFSTPFVDAVAGGFYNDLLENEVSDLPSMESAQALGLSSKVGTPSGPNAAFPYYYFNNLTIASDRNKVLAGFADATLHPASGLDVYAGYRDSQEKLSYNYIRYKYSTVPVQNGTTFDLATLQPLVAPLTLAFPGTHTETDWAGRAGIAYELMPRTKAYFTASRGYVGAGVDLGNGTRGTAANPGAALLRPSITTNYELGLKTEVFDRRLRLNAALFDMFTKDPQVSALVPGTNINVIQNAGNIRAKGIEVNSEAQVAPAFYIAGGLAYLDAVYEDLTQPCYPNQINIPGAGCLVNGTQNVSGKPALNAPKWKGNVAATYNLELPSAPFDVYLRADYRYMSKVYFQLDHDPLATQPGYGILDLAVGFLSKDKRYEFRLFVDNLADTYFCSDVVNGPSARQSCQGAEIDAQRRFGASAKFNF
jgi:iron complex outermembrane receptor protein